MRLLTHNMLRCNVKGVENGYPLVIDAEKVEVVQSDFDPEVIRGMLKKINFDALKAGANCLSMSELDDIEAFAEEMQADEEFLRRVHRLLFEVHVLDGALVCPETGRRFPVKDGIPNMLLHEDEV